MVLGFLFGWNRRVRGLRKRWDRLREKSLKKGEPIRRMALERLDMIENNLKMLEEQRMDRVSRARIAKEVEIGLEEVNAMMKMKPEELGAQPGTAPPQGG